MVLRGWFPTLKRWAYSRMSLRDSVLAQLRNRERQFVPAGSAFRLPLSELSVSGFSVSAFVQVIR
jgi:hypothetical protein